MSPATYSNAACQTSNTLMPGYLGGENRARYTLPDLRFPSPLDSRLFNRTPDLRHVEDYQDDVSTSSSDDHELWTSSSDEDEHGTYEFYFPRPPQQAPSQASPRPGYHPPDVENPRRQPSLSYDPVMRSKTQVSRKASRLSRMSRSSTKDPNLVTWDGPDDPKNPHNWSKSRRWMSMLLVSSFTFISPVASTMVAPALDTIAKEFDIQSDIEKQLVMSIFLLAYAVGPFLWGPLSEVYGRVRVLQCANLIYLLFNTVCGSAKTTQQMMAFRFLSGIGGSAPQAIGGGVLSDCFRADQRGSAIAIYSLMPFLGPALGPVAGGYIAQYTTWRWVFWSTSIFGAAVQILCFFFLKETYAPALLGKKAERLRKETGNSALHTKWQGPDHSMKKILMKSLVRPFIMLGTQPALQSMAVYRGYQYGIMYLVLATFPRVFEGYYRERVDRASLNYLSLGIGFVIGLQISGPMQDRVYAYCKRKNINPDARVFSKSTWKAPQTSEAEEKLAMSPQSPSFQIPRKPVQISIQRQGTHKSTQSNKSFTHDPTKALPEYRLPLTLPFGLLIPIGLIIYGWGAEKRLHWIVPNIGSALFAIGLIICFNCAQAYVVDTYTTYAASATGAAAFVRTMAGFSFPLFAPKMYDTFGVGKGNSLLAGISLVLGVVAPIALWRFGSWLRKHSTYCAG